MSSRRETSRKPAASSRITEEQIAALVSRMEQAIPEITRRTGNCNKVSATKVLEETCVYIRGLQREISDLSERLSQLLATADVGSDEAAVIRALLTGN